jgi:hypothetical protein
VVLREIIEGGGDGTLCEARLIDGVTDDDIEALFQSARAADYAQIAEKPPVALPKLCRSKSNLLKPVGSSWSTR